MTGPMSSLSMSETDAGTAMETERKRAIETILTSRGTDDRDPYGAVVPALYTSATFARTPDYELSRGYNYRRYGSPNVADAERLIASLEDGEEALLFASGLAAMSTFLDALRPGARVVAPIVMYHGGLDILRRLDGLGRISLQLVDPSNPESIARSIALHSPNLIWIESPCNPTWDVVDIRAVAGLARKAGSMLVVDGTVAPPCTTRALHLGADIVFHSTTKYLNGHHDMTGGVLVTRHADEGWQELRTLRKLAGNILSPFDAWLLIRGLRTLCVRFHYSSGSALRIAEFLDGHNGVDQVLYPGLPDHPSHRVACRQMTGGFGAMLSVLVQGGAQEALRVARSTELFLPATSLGGVESLIEHRRSVEGPNSVVPENLLRLSIGLEATDDLIADLDQALAQARRG